jgi:hypothetical protein
MLSEYDDQRSVGGRTPSSGLGRAMVMVRTIIWAIGDPIGLTLWGIEGVLRREAEAARSRQDRLN